MDPAIDDFVAMVKIGTKKEKLQAFNALENYALQLKEEYRNRGEAGVQVAVKLVDIIPGYGHKSPTVGGSCGSSSNNPLTAFEALRKELGLDEDEWFNCPKCGYEATGPIGDQCPGCGLTKDEHAEAGGETC